MSITISENPNEEAFKSRWRDIVGAVEPDIARLPEPWKGTFEGILSLLMSSTLSLGIIPERRMLAFHELRDWIIEINKYPDFVNYDLTYIASVVTKLFGDIEFSMAQNGRFLLEGPMSRSFMTQTQHLTQDQQGRYKR